MWIINYIPVLDKIEIKSTWVRSKTCESSTSMFFIKAYNLRGEFYNLIMAQNCEG